MFDYLNVVYWLIAVASLIGWARFAAFLSEDVTKRLVDQPELPWKLGAMGVLLVMLLVYLAMPSFWVAFPINFCIAGGMVAAFWMVRVKTLGAAGHLFKGTLDSVANVSSKMEERRAAKQVQLSYLRHDERPMPLPRPEDPLAAGLAAADSMIIQALLRRAELVDLAPTETAYSFTMTVDGVSLPQPAIDRPTAENAIQALKVLAGLVVEERRRPQVGKFKSRDAEGTITTWTVRTSGSTAGERVMLSANEAGRWDIPLDQLGLSADQLNELKSLANDTRGVALITSPKGQGKTTTMYALLRQHDAFTNSVQTLEINPQAELEGVTVNRFDPRNTDAPFAKQLQSIFLKDPGIVLVSQIPDAPTAQAVARYAEQDNGHRIIASIPAADTFAALDLWVGLVADKALAMRSLRVIVAQRLVRILCPTCKIPYQPDEATLKRLNLPVGRNLQSFKANTDPIVDKKGNKIICPDCGGMGFHGRTGIFEVLVITDELRKAVSANANINQIKALARKQNMIFLIEHGIRKFATGITAINEVTRVMTPDKQPPPKSARSGVAPAQQ